MSIIGGPDNAPRDVTLSRTVIAYVERVRKLRKLTTEGFAQLLTDAGRPTTTATWANRAVRRTAVLSIDEAVTVAAVLNTTLDGLVEAALSEKCLHCDGNPPAGFSCTTCGSQG